MGVPGSHDPGSIPAMPDDLPYLSIGVLTAGLLDLLEKADGLPQPWNAAVDEADQLLTLEFGPGEASIPDLNRWADRFGGVLQSHSCDLFGQPSRHVTCTFPFHGVTVSAFAFIPVPGLEDHS